MLIIKRRIGSMFSIGADINVLILGIDGGAIKLGIQAPAHYPVLRDDAIKREPLRPDVASGQYVQR